MEKGGHGGQGNKEEIFVASRVSYSEKEKASFCVREIKVGDEVVTVLLTRSRKAPKDADWLVASVKAKTEKVYWQIKDEQAAGFVGLAKLRLFKGEKGEEYVIALCEKGPEGWGIIKVLPLIDLVKAVPVKIGNAVVLFNGRTPEQLTAMKIELAEQLGEYYSLSVEEERIARMHEEDEERISAAKRLEESAASLINFLYAEAVKKYNKDKKHAEAKAKKEAIMSREVATAYTKDGKKVFGIPVVGEEWKGLPNNTAVLLVSSLEGDGEPLSAFFVRKRQGQQPDKAGEKSGLSWEGKSVTVRVTAVAEDRFIILVVPDEDGNVRRKEFRLFSPEEVKALREAGVNSGTQIALNKPNKQGNYQVVALTAPGEDMSTVGCYPAYKG